MRAERPQAFLSPPFPLLPAEEASLDQHPSQLKRKKTVTWAGDLMGSASDEEARGGSAGESGDDDSLGGSQQGGAPAPPPLLQELDRADLEPQGALLCSRHPLHAGPALAAAHARSALYAL